MTPEPRAPLPRDRIEHWCARSWPSTCSSQPCADCGGSAAEPRRPATCSSRGRSAAARSPRCRSADALRVLRRSCSLTGWRGEIAAKIVKEIGEPAAASWSTSGSTTCRLDRSADTLSGGEAQRIRLASRRSARDWSGVMYVLDEPSIGLHQRDNAAAARHACMRLRDLGNTVIVVEHDEDAIRTADHVVDIGPGAGVHGGRIVAQGTPAEIMAASRLADRPAT
ncbi:MAG: hypothetical protein MZW92_41670 [Comamonadaceae bacterium]|nr:hypothetical protein [Comamonadaceae bacterium]